MNIYMSRESRYFSYPDSTCTTDGTVWFYDSNGAEIRVTTNYIYVLGGMPSLRTIRRVNAYLTRKGYTSTLDKVVEDNDVYVTITTAREVDLFDHCNTAYPYN